MANGEEGNQSQVSSDTLDFFGRMGIDPTEFSLGAGAAEGLVFVGQGEDEEEETRPVTEYKKDLMRTAPGDLPRLQRRLWEGGFYDRSLDWEDIRQGDYDDVTRDAWKRAVERAAAFYDSGENRTLDEVIDMARYVDAEGGTIGRGTGRGTSAAAPTIRQSHPDDIRTIAMKASTAVLGRGWSQEELDRFVSTYQVMERSAQSAARRGGVVTEAPSVQSAVERVAREEKPVEAEATDQVNAYGAVFQAMQKLGQGAR